MTGLPDEYKGRWVLHCLPEQLRRLLIDRGAEHKFECDKLFYFLDKRFSFPTGDLQPTQWQSLNMKSPATLQNYQEWFLEWRTMAAEMGVQ